jgi:hypothetical protein
MISLPQPVRVFLHTPATDLRKGFDALSGLVTIRGYHDVSVSTSPSLTYHKTWAGPWAGTSKRGGLRTSRPSSGCRV